MKFTIDIDTGGTFTHGFITGDGNAKTVTTPTTPHDLTVCLANCIKQGAKAFGVSLIDMLINTESIRYSTTTATNAMIQKTGSKIGLIVTKGFEDTLYAPQGKVEEPVYHILQKDMIASVEEDIDENGNIKRPLSQDEVIEKMQSLIDKGARTIVVSLRNANANQIHEKEIKRIIKEKYPSSYLGTTRVFLSSDISDEPGDYYQTTSALMDAYVHDILVKYLYKAEDDLRDSAYEHPLMICNSRGGVARVAKTKAIDTYNSGPVAGLNAAFNLGKVYNCNNVITVDIGGTSIDVGLVRDGIFSYESFPRISDITINVPMIDVYSVGFAGGSIINLDSKNNIMVGPKSAGARPGPACFNLGGMQPTVTDADVVLGLIDPNYFLGGRMKLNKEKAVAAIKRIADKLKATIPETALMIKNKADKDMQDAILIYLADKKINLDSLPNFISVVYGGAGATHCCGFNSGLKFNKTVVSPFASAFSAFGSSMADLLHVYSKYSPIQMFDGANYLQDYKKFNSIVNELYRKAQRDIKGEGYPVNSAKYNLELTMIDESSNTIRIIADKLELSSEADVKGLCTIFSNTRTRLTGTSAEVNKIFVHSIVFNALIDMPHWKFKATKLGSQDPGPAFKGEREVFWLPQNGYQNTPIYERDLLSPGNIIKGPAIVDGRDTTYVIPGKYSLTIDEYSNAIIMEER